MKYTDQEVIRLTRLNPGFGISRFIKQLYPNTHKLTHLRYRLTMFLDEYHKESGEDLYELIQSSEFSTRVSEKEYKEITGSRNVPVGYGRNAGGRIPRPERKNPTGTFGKPILLPPQEFNWGGIEGPNNREWRNQAP